MNCKENLKQELSTQKQIIQLLKEELSQLKEQCLAGNQEPEVVNYSEDVKRELLELPGMCPDKNADATPEKQNEVFGNQKAPAPESNPATPATSSLEILKLNPSPNTPIKPHPSPTSANPIDPKKWYIPTPDPKPIPTPEPGTIEDCKEMMWSITQLSKNIVELMETVGNQGKAIESVLEQLKEMNGAQTQTGVHRPIVVTRPPPHITLRGGKDGKSEEEKANVVPEGFDKSSDADMCEDSDLGLLQLSAFAPQQPQEVVQGSPTTQTKPAEAAQFTADADDEMCELNDDPPTLNNADKNPTK